MPRVQNQKVNQFCTITGSSNNQNVARSLPYHLYQLLSETFLQLIVEKLVFSKLPKMQEIITKNGVKLKNSLT